MLEDKRQDILVSFIIWSFQTTAYPLLQFLNNTDLKPHITAILCSQNRTCKLANWIVVYCNFDLSLTAIASESLNKFEHVMSFQIYAKTTFP